MAGLFDISTHALTVPDIDTCIGLMHTLFTLEDVYGLKISKIDGELCLRLDKSNRDNYSELDASQHWAKVPSKALSDFLVSE